MHHSFGIIVSKKVFPPIFSAALYTSFLHCFPFKNIPPFLFFAHEEGRQQASVGHSALTTLINPLHCSGMGSKRERERLLGDGDKGRREAEFGREERVVD